MSLRRTDGPAKLKQINRNASIGENESRTQQRHTYIPVAGPSKLQDITDQPDKDGKRKKSKSTFKWNKAWVTAQMSEYSSQELTVKTTISELLIYLIFLIILMTVVLGMTSSTMYYYTKVLSDLFLETATQDGTSFKTINTYHDFWEVTDSVLVDAFYWDFWYRENETQTSVDDKKILYENKVLGVPRLRQLRVRNDSCVVHQDFKRNFESCYDFYSSQAEDTEPFGPGTATAWQYKTHKELGGASYWGQITTYGGGGYYQDLPISNRDNFVDTLHILKENLWLNRGTRAVFLDFTVYNANINLFCVIKMIIEIPPTGGVLPSWSFRTMKLIRYVTPFDYFILACELMFVVFILYYSAEEIREICYFKQKYFYMKWNWMDLAILTISYVCIGFSIYRIIIVSAMLKDLIKHEKQYPNFEYLGFGQLQFNNALAILVFFVWIKIFKYISFNRTMTQLSTTLNRCAKDIAGFAVMFFIVFVAFAQLGYLLFGTQVVDFSTFTSSVFSLLRIILGDFEYTSIEKANGILGPIFFLCYIFFVFIVLLNMFLAIINDTYTEVKTEVALDRRGFLITDLLRRGYDNIMKKLGRKEKIRQPGDKLTGEDIRKALQKCNFTDGEIETFFLKYDLQPEDEIGEDEAKQMLLEFDEKTQYGQITPPTQQSSTGLAGVTAEEFYGLQARMENIESAVASVTDKVDAVIQKLDKRLGKQTKQN